MKFFPDNLYMSALDYYRGTAMQANNFMRNNSQSGFNLVELMIVIAIIGILAAIALPQYAAYRNKAKARHLVSHARACIMEAMSNCQGNVHYVPSSHTTGACQTNGFTLPTGEPITITAPATCGLAGATIYSLAIATVKTPYAARCIGRYNDDITCNLTP